MKEIGLWKTTEPKGKRGKKPLPKRISEFFGSRGFWFFFPEKKNTYPHASCATKSPLSIRWPHQSYWHTKCYIFDALSIITKSRPREYSHLPYCLVYPTEYQSIPPFSQSRRSRRQRPDPGGQFCGMVQTHRPQTVLCPLAAVSNRQYFHLLRDGGWLGQVIW